MSSLVRDEFGPTLPELIASRTGRPVRRVRQAIVAVVVLVVVVALGVRFAQREAAQLDSAVVTGGAFAFNLAYDGDRLERVDPLAGERLRLTTASDAETTQSFVVRQRELPSYEGDVTGFLPRYTSSVISAMAADDPAFLLRGESRARINDNPGYMIVFQTKIGGTTAYGRRLLLYDDPDDNEATLNRPTVVADITMINGRSKAVPNANSVGGNGALKTPYRSFRFGDKRP